MGGKSTIMRQAALSIILAQIGCLIPAKSMKLSVIDRIFTRIGGSDNLMKGESTFFIELNETASILQHATNQSFIIIDELGRGTATHDGSSIARAVYEKLATDNNLAIVSSHYHNMVKQILNSNFSQNLQLCHMQCLEEYDPDDAAKLLNVLCLYKLISGLCPQSHGFSCAKKAEIENHVVDFGVKYAERLNKMSQFFETVLDL